MMCQSYLDHKSTSSTCAKQFVCLNLQLDLPTSSISFDFLVIVIDSLDQCPINNTHITSFFINFHWFTNLATSKKILICETMCLKLLVYETAIPWTSVPESCILILINVCSLQLNLAHSFVNIRSAFAIFSLNPDHSSLT